MIQQIVETKVEIKMKPYYEKHSDQKKRWRARFTYHFPDGKSTRIDCGRFDTYSEAALAMGLKKIQLDNLNKVNLETPGRYKSKTIPTKTLSSLAERLKPSLLTRISNHFKTQKAIDDENLRKLNLLELPNRWLKK